MRIIGGHDYYDSGLAFGQDSSVLFLRNGTRRFSSDEMYFKFKIPRVKCYSGLLDIDDKQNYETFFPYNGEKGLYSGKKRFISFGGTVIFCGKIYHGQLVAVYDAKYGGPLISKTWFWSIDSLREFAAENNLRVNENKNSSSYDWVRENGSTSKRVEVLIQDADEFFAPKALPSESLELLIQERITIASLDPANTMPQDSDGIERNWFIDQPTLGAMGFAKAVEPYIAFQEIAMFKGGVLGSDAPPIVEIVDNNIKIAKHGFDTKTSFRRGKEAI